MIGFFLKNTKTLLKLSNEQVIEGEGKTSLFFLNNFKGVRKMHKGYTTNTFNQEMIQCAALAFFIKKSSASNGDFIDYLEYFYNGQDEDDVLDLVKAQYNIKSHLGVFHTSSDAGRSWVRSSIDIARFLINKLNLTANYQIHHQKSQFGRFIKDECTKAVYTALDTKNISNKPDVYNPTDLWIVNKSHEREIRRELGTHIISKKANIVGNYATNEHTYKSILDKYYEKDWLFQISLKKAKGSTITIDDDYKNKTSSSNLSIGYKIVGTTMKFQQRKADIDPYTKFLLAFDQVLQEGNKSNIMGFINRLVIIKKINYRDETLQPNLIFELNYEGVNVEGGGVERWKLDTPGDTFNMQKSGGTAWSGGLNTNGIHQILTNYTDYNEIFKEVQTLRKEAFLEVYKGLTNENTTPGEVKALLDKSEIIYKQDDLKKIKDRLNNDAYIRFLVSAIERLSKPYRGELAKYGIHGENESLRLTQKEKVVTITKKGEEKEVTKTVSTLKKGQTITKLRTKRLIAKSNEIEYDTILKGKVGDINPKDYIFIIDKNGKIENGTRIEKIDIRKRVITLSAPLKGGTDLKSPAATALILNPWQTNVVSSSDLATIRGNKSQKYLEEKFSKLQAFYMFMKGGKQRLNQVLKKQIVLTIYGLVSKKGGKLFDPNLTKSVKDKVFAKNAISEYIIPAFIIVGD